MPRKTGKSSRRCSLSKPQSDKRSKCDEALNSKKTMKDRTSSLISSRIFLLLMQHLNATATRTTTTPNNNNNNNSSNKSNYKKHFNNSKRQKKALKFCLKL